MSQLDRRLLAVLLLLTAFACSAQEPAGESFARVALEPERAPAAGEALWLEVFVGKLPAGASLAVRDEAGAELGTISPFGKPVREAGGSHLVPLPAALQQAKKIELRLELRQAGKVRRPTEGELRRVELVYVPVSG